MKNEEITAEWARKEATTVLGAKVARQVDDCLTAIKSSVSRNEMNCHVDMYADKLTIAELTKRGFQCEQLDDQRDGSSLTIKW